MTTVALIPARSGSKGILDKNIRTIAGKPMLAYSIEHALTSRSVDRVFVSTDSETYRTLAVELGAEAPFLRPDSISGDHATDFEVFQHFVAWVAEHKGKTPDILVHLRPTHPVRNPKDIDQMVALLQKRTDADSVRSVSKARQTPYKMWLFQENDYLSPVATCAVPEAYNSPRQALPTVYMQNACIDVTRSATIQKKNSMTGEKILGYVIPYDFDIDSEDDIVNADLLLSAQYLLKKGKSLKLCFDVDGIIAQKIKDNDYAKSRPIAENIRFVNSLFEKGHTVLLFTARGSETGLDWTDVTKKQMREWGVKFHAIEFGKPNADMYIDDKNSTIDGLRQLFGGR